MNMRSILILALLTHFCLAWLPSSRAADELPEIRAAAQKFVEAFNKHDAKAVAACWATNGEYRDEAGRNFSGREAIEQEYAKFFREQPKAKIIVQIDSLRMLGDATALEEGRAELEPAPSGPPGGSRYTAIHVRENGKWLLALVKDEKAEVPSHYRHLADLEWLIGTWTAEDRGAKTEWRCRWLNDKSFVERTFTTTQPNGTKTSGVQIIGHNGVTRQVQSWSFNADGSHAVGVWVPIQGGWQATVRGITADGLPTLAVNRLLRLDDNAYSWQSTNRSIGETILPDSDEVVMKRATTK